VIIVVDMTVYYYVETLYLASSSVNIIYFQWACLSYLSCSSFIVSRLHAGDSQVKWKESNRFFNFKFRCIDDVLSLNKVDDCVDAIEFEIKHFKDTAESTSCLDLHLDIDSEVNNGMLRQRRWFQYLHCKLSIYIFVYVTTLKQHLHVKYISLSWLDIPEPVFPIMITWLVKMKSYLGKFTATTMTWLTATVQLCYKWPRIFYVCCSWLSPG
jgi:hypothetical protein